MHAYTHTYIHAYIHTYIHTYMHTYILVMCDNDFTSLSIIMIILSRYDSYHDGYNKIVKTTELPLGTTILTQICQTVTSIIHT